MPEPFIAEIRIFPFGFTPEGWAPCDGQLLPISQYTALFSIVGTTYGGNGVSTFALPDLRGAAPMQAGQGAGLSHRDLGETGGETSLTLTVQQIAPHTHGVACSSEPGRETGPANANIWAHAGGARGERVYASTGGATMALDTLGPTGGGLPHNNMPPYLALHFCIALEGVFPRRP